MLYTVYGRKISSRLAQLNLVSLGTKGNYKEGQELFLAIALGTTLTDMISPVYNFLALNFCTQGFLCGVLFCLKIESWKEMNRVILTVNAFVFVCIVFGLNFWEPS